METFDKSVFAKRLVALVLCIVIGLSCILTACNKPGDENTATADSAATTEPLVTEVFKFADGVTVGGADIGGMTFDVAYQMVEAAAEDTVNDFTLTVVAEDKKYNYTKKDFQWEFNIQEVLEEAATFKGATEPTDNTDSTSATALQAGTYTLIAQVTADSVNAVVNKIAKDFNVAAVDATIAVEGDKVNISREKSGKAIDKKDLSAKIIKEVNALVAGAENKASVQAVINEVAPKNKFEDFDGEIELLATYSTYSTNTYNGNQNMALALAACDGSVIDPGEVWSFNACTGNSNLTSLGYLPATVIAGGKFQQGIGGGICQASTTIYNAAILANMEITERYYHYYQSSYAAAGRDATIDYPNLDLKLSNPTKYPMYMQCYMEGTQLTVNIYGWNDPAFDNIEIESYVHSSNEEGYGASAFRVYYLDGKETGREELPSSWYAYPDNGDDDEDETTTATKPKTTKPKDTKPKATKPQTNNKPQATKPKATKPVVTEPKETKPQTNKPKPTKPVATEPKETTPKATKPQATKPQTNNKPQATKPKATEATSGNEQNISTAIAQY